MTAKGMMKIFQCCLKRNSTNSISDKYLWGLFLIISDSEHHRQNRIEQQRKVVNQFLEMGFEIPQIQEAVEATQSYETHDLLLYLGSLGGKASLYTLLDIFKH